MGEGASCCSRQRSMRRYVKRSQQPQQPPPQPTRAPPCHPPSPLTPLVSLSLSVPGAAHDLFGSAATVYHTDPSSRHSLTPLTTSTSLRPYSGHMHHHSHTHPTASRPARVGAQQRVGVATTDVAYINTARPSTAYNDKFETGDQGLRRTREGSAYLLTKSMTGHTLGAAGGIEAVIAAKVMQTGTPSAATAHQPQPTTPSHRHLTPLPPPPLRQTGVVPPTINYETPDPECDLAPRAKHGGDSGDQAKGGHLGP